MPSSPFAAAAVLPLAALLCLSACIIVPVPLPTPGAAARPMDRSPAPNPCPISPETATAQAKGLAALNAARKAAGLPGFATDPRLTKAAQDHACDMAASLRIDHAGSDGSDLRTRLDRAGLGGMAWAENVGLGIDDPADMVAGWMQSPPHRANILTPRMGYVGLALSRDVQGRAYWALDFIDHP